jgi:hypothetical protein
MFLHQGVVYLTFYNYQNNQLQIKEKNYLINNLDSWDKKINNQ